MGRVLKVDHTRYKRKDGEEEEERERMQTTTVGVGAGMDGDEGAREGFEEERPMLKEEVELAKLVREHDEDDPMKEFLVQEKREAVADALAKLKDGKEGGKRKRKYHKHNHHHRQREERRKSDADEEARRRRRKHERRR